MKKAEKILHVHGNGQASLGTRYAGKIFQMTVLATGQILLTPGSFRPEHHETFFTPEALARLDDFERWSQTSVGKEVPKQDAMETLKELGLGKK